MGCKSKYRGKEAFGFERAARPSSQGRALEPAGDCRPREMTVAPQGEQNPAYSPESLFYRGFRHGETLFSKPIRQRAFQRPVVEGTLDTDIAQIIVRKVKLGVVEGVAVAEIKPILGELR